MPIVNQTPHPMKVNILHLQLKFINCVLLQRVQIVISRCTVPRLTIRVDIYVTFVFIHSTSNRGKNAVGENAIKLNKFT